MFINGKRIALLLIPFMLFACGKKPKTPEFFLLHPEYIQPVYDQCVTIDSPSDTRSMECVSVMAVIPVFKQYLSELAANSQQYGLRIMQAQIRLVELQIKLGDVKKQLQAASPNEAEFQHLQALQEQLEHEIYRQKLHISSRQAVLRVVQQQF